MLTNIRIEKEEVEIDNEMNLPPKAWKEAEVLPKGKTKASIHEMIRRRE